MLKGFAQVPVAINEPVKNYIPGSAEREELQKKLAEMQSEVIQVPMIINGKEVSTDQPITLKQPHKHQHILGYASRGTAEHVKLAIDAALAAKEKWEKMSWENRAAIFLKAADMVAGPERARINAATMLGQSKSVYQAEIDAACEFADFLRFNVQYMTEIYSDQPVSAPGIWNRVEQRPLEGFVFALTPFNFTAIAGNLPSSAALMGNII